MENMSEKDLRSFLMKTGWPAKWLLGRQSSACWADFINFQDIGKNAKHNIVWPFKHALIVTVYESPECRN